MQEEPEVSMFTDTELLDAVGTYFMNVVMLRRHGLVHVDAPDYDAIGIGVTVRKAITNCITAIKDEQGENQ